MCASNIWPPRPLYYLQGHICPRIWSLHYQLPRLSNLTRPLIASSNSISPRGGESSSIDLSRQSVLRYKTQETWSISWQFCITSMCVPLRRLSRWFWKRWLLAGNRLITFHLSQNLVIGADLERNDRTNSSKQKSERDRDMIFNLLFSVLHMPDSLLRSRQEILQYKHFFKISFLPARYSKCALCKKHEVILFDSNLISWTRL